MKAAKVSDHESKVMDPRRLNLQELGVRLRAVDDMLVDLIALRTQLALQVEAYKRMMGQKIVRPKIEAQRIAASGRRAAMLGANPQFVKSLMHQIINESCKVQLGQLESSRGKRQVDLTDDVAWQTFLRSNLLRMTKEFARSYDAIYEEQPLLGVASYRRFEQEQLMRIIDEMKDGEPLVEGVALDLGSAVGIKSFELAQHFTRVVGVDLSDHMVTLARERATAAGVVNAQFMTADLEEGIPLEDSSASLVVCNMGTASEIRNFRMFLKEISRVLKHGGYALLSLYNTDALLYRFDFLPWQAGLNAAMNRKAECLDVRFGKSVYSIFARAYSREGLQEQLPVELAERDWSTFPTLGAILPNTIMAKVRDDIERVDRQLASSDLGSYIILTLHKH